MNHSAAHSIRAPDFQILGNVFHHRISAAYKAAHFSSLRIPQHEYRIRRRIPSELQAAVGQGQHVQVTQSGSLPAADRTCQVLPIAHDVQTLNAVQSLSREWNDKGKKAQRCVRHVGNFQCIKIHRCHHVPNSVLRLPGVRARRGRHSRYWNFKCRLQNHVAIFDPSPHQQALRCSTC